MDLHIIYEGRNRLSIGPLWTLHKGLKGLSTRHKFKRDGIRAQIQRSKQSRPDHWGRVVVILSGSEEVILKERDLLDKFLLENLDFLSRNHKARAGILGILEKYGIRGFNWSTGLAKQGIIKGFSMLGISVEYYIKEDENGKEKS